MLWQVGSCRVVSWLWPINTSFFFWCTPAWSVKVMNPKAVLNDAELQPPSVAEYVATFTQRAIDYVLEQFPDSAAADIQA